MKRKIIFIHSAGPQGENHGSSKLITFLKHELKNQYNFIAIKMPKPEDPSYREWKSELDEMFLSLREEVILVGHSLGGSVLLKYLSEENYNVNIAGLFIVAAPFWGLDEDWQRQDFILQNEFEQQLLNIPHLYLYHSREEEIVPFHHFEVYRSKLVNAKGREVTGREHLFEVGLPELVSDIKTLGNDLHK